MKILISKDSSQYYQRYIIPRFKGQYNERIEVSINLKLNEFVIEKNMIHSILYQITKKLNQVDYLSC